MSDREQQLAQAREYMKRWRREHPDRAHENDSRSRARRDKQKELAYQKRWRATNREKVKEWDRRKYLKRRNRIRAEKYGLTVAEVERLMAATACEACGTGFEAGSGCIDHDHESGAVRGVLCKPCNYALGIMGESAGRLRGLSVYAESRCVVPQVVAVIGQAIAEVES